MQTLAAEDLIILALTFTATTLVAVFYSMKLMKTGKKEEVVEGERKISIEFLEDKFGDDNSSLMSYHILEIKNRLEKIREDVERLEKEVENGGDKEGP